MANAVLNMYRVTYHFESSGRKISDTLQDNVAAAAGDYDTLAAVLSGNNKKNGSHGTLVIESVGSSMGTVLT